MRRFAIYARVSTESQDIAPQVDLLREYVSRRDCRSVSEYADAGSSGVNADRAGLRRLLSDARRRQFDVVVCVKLDRLARSVRQLTTLVAEFEALGIDLVVLDQSIDTTTPVGKLTFHVLGAVAEFERDLIRERTSAGMRAARRRGRHVGRPAVRVDEPTLQSAIESGASVSAAARALGVSRATARKLISREVAKRVS